MHHAPSSLFRPWWRGLALASLVVALFSLSSARAEGPITFTWIGGGSNNDLSNDQNWQGGEAPFGWGNDLIFTGAGVTVTNDYSETSFASLVFQTSGFIFQGNTIYSLGFLGFDGDVAGDVRFENEISASQDFLIQFSGDSQSFTFANSLTPSGGSSMAIAGLSTFGNVVRLVGPNGAIPSFSPTPVTINKATLSLDNSEGIATGRVQTVELGTGGRLLLNGNSSAEIQETVRMPFVTGTNIVEVLNPGTTYVNALTLESFDPDDTATTLFTANPTTPASGLGNAARIYLDGFEASAFLGPQFFFLNGPIGAAISRYEFAAYDETRGVISATTSNNLTLAKADANVLLNASETFAGTTARLNSLAFNGANLFGPGTINLSHLLVTRDLANIYNALDFGDTAGTITTTNWDIDLYPRIYLSGAISGTGSLEFRGFGETYALADSSFSGDLAITGGFLNLMGAGSFANATSITIRSAEDQYSFLRIGGWAGVNPDRLGDDAEVSIYGTASIALYSDSDPTSSVATTEQIGPVTIFQESDLTLLVSDGWYGSSRQNPALAGSLIVSSLQFAPSGEGQSSSLRVTVRGENNSVVIQGGPIEVADSNVATFDLQDNGARIETGGVHLDSFSADVFLYVGYQTEGGAPATFVGDLLLENGNFTFEGSDSNDFIGRVNLEGDFTMGEGLNFYLSLGTPDDGLMPLFSLSGDLTISGAILIQQMSEFTSGRWLLFEVGGTILDNGWSISGFDGSYTYSVEGNKVYIDSNFDDFDQEAFGDNIVVLPEPSTYALIALGALVLILAVRRRRLA